MADSKIEMTRAELQALMDEILQEYRGGAVAREDLDLREVMRSTVWGFNNRIRDDISVWIVADDAEESGLIEEISADGADLRDLRGRREWTVDWAREAHQAIERSVARLSRIKRTIPSKPMAEPPPGGVKTHGGGGGAPRSSPDFNILQTSGSGGGPFKVGL